MVDALKECWRVLEQDGILIDLRPFYSNPPLEILVGQEHYIPGNIDDEGGVADDIAADEAMAEVVRQGCFALEARDSFRYGYYWDSLDGMLDFVDEYWQNDACVPPPVIAAARLCISVSGDSYQVRIGRLMHIAVYRKRS